MKKFLVLINKPQVPLLSYLGDETMCVGDLVIVPFRNKDCTAIIYDEDKATHHKFELKQIKHVFKDISLPSYTIKLLDDFSNYYIIDKGSSCKMFIPLDLKGGNKVRHINQIYSPNLPELKIEQADALSKIINNEKVTLLQGVTGSGKTEVYFHAINEFIKKDKQVLLLLPEIGLTRQVIDRFKSCFGFTPETWHSGVTSAKKRDIFYGAARGNIKVVIGTRSSIFLPFVNLGMIIIDEEHDGSYKQEENSLYNARDTAALKAKVSGAKLVLVSATPSIETYLNVKIGKYSVAKLENRYSGRPLARISTIDMKKEERGKWISGKLRDSIQEAIENKNQVILFINRRGYAPLVLCRCCGYRFCCKDCSSWLVYHKNKEKLICHHCGFEESYPKKCPECTSTELISSGPGVERVCEEAKMLFPNANIQDFTGEKNSNENGKEILNKMENGEIDILVGTQIISKGYHFPKVSVVGVIDADFVGSNIDLKSSERCFQILTQVSGRSGRSDVEGSAIFQTYYPDNHIFELLKQNDHAAFYEAEIESRRNNFLPPFSRIIALMISGPDEFITRSFSIKLKNSIKANERVKVLGPAPASMSKLKGKFRFRILIITEKKVNIQQDAKKLLERKISHKDIIVRAEVDPYSFY